MRIVSYKSPLLKTPGDFWLQLEKILKKTNWQKGDVLAIASKVVSLSEQRLIKKSDLSPSPRAKQLAKQYQVEPNLAQAVLKEAEQIIGGSKGAILTLKNSLPIANAGIDNSNSPPGSYLLWPKNPAKSVQQISLFIKKKFKKSLPLIIVDSHCSPSRLGTTGFALAITGFNGVKDYRYKKDLFGKKLKITFANQADSLASAASLIMGEAAEKTPFCLVRKAPIKLSRKTAAYLTKQLLINRRSCLFHQSKL